MDNNDENVRDNWHAKIDRRVLAVDSRTGWRVNVVDPRRKIIERGGNGVGLS